MSDNIQQIKDDLSYMRELAGDDGMVLRASGIGLMVGGVVFPLVGLRVWLIDKGWLAWPDSLKPLMPFDGILLFFVALFTCFYLDSKGKKLAPPKPNAASRAMWASWAAVGVGYGVTAISCSLAGVPGVAVLALFPFWGGGWAVVWAIYRHTWLLVLAQACYLLAIVVALLWDSELRGVLFSIGWLALVALPGWFIYRYARSLQ